VEFGVHRLQVRQGNLFLQDHLVEANDEIRINETPVEYREAEASSDELEVVQVFGVNARSRIDL